LAGAVLTTASAVGFIALLIALFFGLFSNPYASLVVFVVMPALVLLGLLLIPLGMWLEHRRLVRHPGAEREWFVIDFRSAATRRRVLMLVALTAVNAVIVLVAGYGAIHSMESPSFCGQTCHTPMHPQFTAWQGAPHSEVACVQCHIGEGGHAFVKYKMNGLRQLYHVVTGHYPRPIPGVADLRPAHEVCATCHWSGKGFGNVIRVKREYADDEPNTETATILQMFLGGPGAPTPSGRAIHWHADPRVRIEFIFTDAERQTIPFVKYTDAQGRVHEYAIEGTTPEQLAKGTWRTMDCVDCHNVPAHRVAPTPEQAVDTAIAAGRIDRGLPFVRREGVRLMKSTYQTSDEAARVVDEDLRRFYTSRGRAVDAQVTGAVTALQDIYRRNVFPRMKVTFGTYPDNVGHTTSSGCFRCHDGRLMAKDGSSINSDCEYCHKQIDNPSR
jgi:nitrate/TMAO reductase-like tetraheme cytochrome c subunit